MSSIINYRFKSYLDFSTVAFEGAGLALWELKSEIVSQRKMASKDFDLLFFDAETEEQITDEYARIPRNSHIIVHRIPAWMSKNVIQVRERKTEKPSTSNFSAKKFSKDPPENYVCFRCGNKGHFIQHCPTNNDRNFDIIKIRKPSGIPKDFLERVEGNLEGSTAMLVTDDGFVKARPQVQEWQRHGSLSKGIGEIPNNLKCNECDGLMNRPVRTSCGHDYCEACIMVNDRCNVCSKAISSVSYNSELSDEIKKFLERRD